MQGREGGAEARRGPSHFIAREGGGLVLPTVWSPAKRPCGKGVCPCAFPAGVGRGGVGRVRWFRARLSLSCSGCVVPGNLSNLLVPLLPFLYNRRLKILIQTSQGHDEDFLT